MMELTSILFWILSAASIVCALMVVISKNPMYSVLWLIGVFFTISGHYVMMNAQFLAVVNIIVYAGAIMVLFLFVIMLINLENIPRPNKNIRMKFMAVVSGGLLLWMFLSAIRTADELKPGQMVEVNTGSIGLIENLGKTLFTQYAIPFEICSVLFLSAMVGAVAIGKKD
ncbi:NADH-quinone oxidoreductase subunit J [Haoranjiania flava]|uniref:NADH-quinone oxidoreductase subunit J n=1 Tax=Haoranjiania flava TaxID=1856322 RepID=A0AAE3ILP5_9BACT|nr:NADH-quinone oxidoreductase subunit J [Haoranjiania flava]MCU7693919.1 NADH-quinone oxidoreductase subunit J [Haoranjiania flava]